MKEEQLFSKWLVSRLAGHAVRIENTIGAGIPDINYCHPEHGEHWIETKIARNGKVKLEKEQFAWGMRRAACKGNAWVIALFPKVNIIRLYKFPLRIEQNGKYLEIISLADFMVFKSQFHNGLLSQNVTIKY